MKGFSWVIFLKCRKMSRWALDVYPMIPRETVSVFIHLSFPMLRPMVKGYHGEAPFHAITTFTINYSHLNCTECQKEILINMATWSKYRIMDYRSYQQWVFMTKCGLKLWSPSPITLFYLSILLWDNLRNIFVFLSWVFMILFYYFFMSPHNSDLLKPFAI